METICKIFRTLIFCIHSGRPKINNAKHFSFNIRFPACVCAASTDGKARLVLYNKAAQK